ncbi:MAG: ABC transporter substrate-binding protein [Alphaproteobacteria bacterium]|nr:MAG: ABC transporter substrate-binding protein [Alphaproteobacteria bacterium]
MLRREFMTLVAGAAAAWPLAARAQQPERVRRIGVLYSLAEADPESVVRRAALEKGLKELGWINGGNIRIDYRWAKNDPELIRKFAAELIALAPDVILTSGSVVAAPVVRATHNIPIVFLQVIDPVGSGLIESMAQPGGNVTGFTQFEYSLAGKWLELLEEIAPNLSRVAVLRDATRGPGIGQFAVIQAMAPQHLLELRPINAGDPDEMERGIAAVARSPNTGLVVTVGGTAVRRDLIVAAAAKHRLPAVYPYRYFAADGGLISYGPDTIEPYLRAAGYVDRIFKGEKPANLPVQAPTKYQLAINLKTAKALGLTVPASLLARADEVFE